MKKYLAYLTVCFTIAGCGHKAARPVPSPFQYYRNMPPGMDSADEQKKVAETMDLLKKKSAK